MQQIAIVALFIFWAFFNCLRSNCFPAVWKTARNKAFKKGSGVMKRILDQIHTPNDLKPLSRNALVQLYGEIRVQMIWRLSVTGGHVGSNLAVIEATVALYDVFDSPVDRIAFDVSHQCYTHKLLTERKAAYTDPKKFSTVSGFTNPSESEHNLFPLAIPPWLSVLPAGWQRDGM